MNLDDWRSRINDLDNQILHLLNQRAEAALQIGDLKRRQDLPSYAPDREAEIVTRLSAANGGPLPAAAILALSVAFLGPRATFTHQAALQHFGSGPTYAPSRSIADVFEDVEHTRVEYGVVPVENSTEGAVNITLDRLIDSDTLICGEIYLPISQHLLSQARELPEIKLVISHPQGLAQCRSWLAQNLPDVPTQDVTSTAAAAEQAAGDVTIAAIASDLAAELYGVRVLRPRIEDNPHNATRFLVIGRRAMPNQPGALYRILEPFARRGINLIKIETRPAKSRPWEFVTFLDFEGHRDTPTVAAALNEIEGRTLFLKVLGSYPAA